MSSPQLMGWRKQIGAEQSLRGGAVARELLLVKRDSRGLDPLARNGFARSLRNIR